MKNRQKDLDWSLLYSSFPRVIRQKTLDNISVAEPPLFWAALAPEVRGPGADSGSRQKKAAPAPYSNIFHFEFLKSELLI